MADHVRFITGYTYLLAILRSQPPIFDLYSSYTWIQMLGLVTRVI